MTRSADDEDLMDVVERVLTADTADLRELALIANADPRTLYIGTSLDGVDLRGQDLRGMLLPNLDRAKVRTDAATLFESPDSEGEAEEGLEGEIVRNALVFVASHRLWRLIESYGPQIPGVQFYGPRSALVFAEDCRTFRGAKLIVCQRNLDEGWPWKEPYAPGGVVVLVHDRKLDRPTLKEREENVNYWQAPQILVPTLREDRPTAAAGAPRFPTALRDAILYASADWDTVYDFAREMPFSIFLRASGTPTSPNAWVQLYAWAVDCGVDAERGLRMGLPRGRPGLQIPNYEEILFEQLRWQDADLPRTAKFTAAALFGIEQQQFGGNPRSYIRTIERVMKAQHWHVDRLSGPSPTPIPRLKIHNKGDAIELRIAGAGRPARRDVFTPRALTQIDPDVVPIVVSEMADAATVVSRLVNDHELNVSIRDLVGLDAAGATVWTIVASLAKRVSRTGDFAQRSQFVALLTLRALRDAGPSGSSTMLEDHLLQPDFFQTHRLRVINMRWRDGELTLSVAMIETETTENVEIIRYHLSIGPAGPVLL